MTLKGVFVVSLLALLCSQCNDTDRSVYEKASGIPIPSWLEEEDSYDDGRFVKTTAFKSDSHSLEEYITQHKFGKFNNMHLPQFWGINNLKEKPDINDSGSFYYKSGSSGNISWIYIADLNSRRLWTEIKYPGKPAY